ncbi:MAG: MgtC/SapB family protein [Deltaproteobacteria bacterium]|nr:MgtC/SapB family protein [Deltaproteobacteria bacterium]
MDLDDPPALVGFAIALLLGALIGLEREKRIAEELESGVRKQRGIGGLRTFILFAEAGALAAWLSLELGTPWLFVGVGAMVTAVVLAGYTATSREEGQLGLTTETAALVTFLLGATVLVGHAGMAVALAIATSAVLAFKRPLHGLVERIDRDDLYAGLELLIAAFIVLPVLPNRPVDPWGVLNPWKMWWLVILISALSLVGYVATRALGAGRGIPLTGLAGGLVSSTAVTLSLARRSAEGRGDARLDHALTAGILLAWATMFARIGVLVAAVNAPLLPGIAGPLGAMIAVTGLAAAWHHGRSRAHGAGGDALPLANPFRLVPAIRFALLYAGVLLAVAFAEGRFPARGLYAVAALAGLTDVDAITLSVAQPNEAVAAGPAIAAIAIAAASNTLVKCALAAGIGSRALRRHVVTVTAALLVTAAAAWALATLST